jgi:transcriptional regulator with XRE-family HTH domain
VRTIGERIRNERVMWGMTQEELAEATGIDRDKISRIETSDRQVRVDELTKLADTFEVSVEHLVRDREAITYQRVDLNRPETQEAQRWFEQCVENSLFVRRVGAMYGR